MADERSSSGDEAKTDPAKTDQAKTDQAKTDQAEAGPTSAAPGGLDVDAERVRLEGLAQEIEDGRRALQDVEDDTRPDSDGPTIAAGEGAAIAPPG